jgi:hypothetical protein
MRKKTFSHQIDEVIAERHALGLPITVRAIHKAAGGGSFTTITQRVGAFLASIGQAPPTKVEAVRPGPIPPVVSGVPIEAIAQIRDDVRRDVEAAHQYSMSKVEAAYERLMEMGDNIRSMTRSARPGLVSAERGGGEGPSDPEKDELRIALARANVQLRRLADENGRLIAEREKLLSAAS